MNGISAALNVLSIPGCIFWYGPLLVFTVILHRIAAGSSLPRHPSFGDAASFLISIWIYALLLILTSRGAFACLLAALLIMALYIANAAKKKALREEPLVITDLALGWQVIRFPGLYLPFLPCRMIVAGSVVFGGLGVLLWLLSETEDISWVWMVIAGLPPTLIVMLALAPRSVSAPLSRWLLTPFPLKFDARQDAESFGPLGAAILHLTWHISNPLSPKPQCQGSTENSMPKSAAPDPVAPPVWGDSCRELIARPPSPEKLPHIFLVQAESFCDPRVFSGAVPRDILKNWDRLRSQGQSGAFRVRDFGAYTLRTEFAALTGLPPEALGTYAFYPYLAALRSPVWSLAYFLRELGYRTICMHPFHREFFFRHRAIPHLGFQEFVTIESFPKRDTYGPYISDNSVAEAMTDIIRESSQPVFSFAITMESHGPWLPGRFKKEFPDGDAPKILGLSDPVCRYLAHVKNADAMMGMLAEGLSKAERPGVMALYGDHLPNLPDLITGGDTATPYIVWKTNGSPGGGVKKDIRPEEIGGAILSGGRE
ncbi:LTA synthase family protein [Succinimonas sp.]|uniref:LTA synthase family protein n=1 Tax=Succinimonas sp. TaxID=1936151 RepID=UPI00386B1BD3